MVYIDPQVDTGEIETEVCAMSIAVAEIEIHDADLIDINAMLVIGKKKTDRSVPESVKSVD